MGIRNLFMLWIVEAPDFNPGNRVAGNFYRALQGRYILLNKITGVQECDLPAGRQAQQMLIVVLKPAIKN